MFSSIMVRRRGPWKGPIKTIDFWAKMHYLTPIIRFQLQRDLQNSKRQKSRKRTIHLLYLLKGDWKAWQRPGYPSCWQTPWDYPLRQHSQICSIQRMTCQSRCECRMPVSAGRKEHLTINLYIYMSHSICSPRPHLHLIREEYIGKLPGWRSTRLKWQVEEVWRVCCV